ncbi:MAG: hotdog fold domain-containing protein [Myxococcota bacterium]
MTGDLEPESNRGIGGPSSTPRAEWRVEAQKLADELRAISLALAANELDAAGLRQATELAQQIRVRLDRPRRGRWYDGDAGAATWRSESRQAYFDQSPVRGQLNPIAPPLLTERAERPDGTPIMRGWARLGLAYEGPPRGVHGGWVAALFDDLLGATQGLADRPGVTGILEVKYRAITPLDRDLRFEGWISEDRGRRIIARGSCHAGATLTADAKAMFVRVDFNEIERQMRERATE